MIHKKSAYRTASWKAGREKLLFSAGAGLVRQRTGKNGGLQVGVSETHPVLTTQLALKPAKLGLTRGHGACVWLEANISFSYPEWRQQQRLSDIQHAREAIRLKRLSIS